MSSSRVAVGRPRIYPSPVADEGSPVARPPWTGPWRRWFVEPVLGQLTQGITPEQISLSLALGGACAFFPVLGAATPLCILVAGALRLNQAVVQVVNAVTSPLYPLVVLGLVRLGDFFLGAAPAELNPAAWIALLQHDPMLFLHRFGPLAGHAILGWLIVAPAWVAVSYFCLRPALRALAPAPRLAVVCLPLRGRALP